MSPELVARLLTQIFVTSDPPAAIYSTLPPRVAAAYASADKFVSSVRNQVSKNGMDVRAGNELDAARRLLANIGVGPRRVAGMVAGGCHDASPPPPPSADGALIRVVKASPDVNPYNQILSYCPHGTEDRYLGPNPVTTPEFRRMRDPENSAFDIIELRIRVLSQASVSDIRKMCVGVKRVGEELEEDGRRVGRGPRVSVDRDDVASIGTLSGGNLQILADQATSTLLSEPRIVREAGLTDVFVRCGLLMLGKGLSGTAAVKWGHVVRCFGEVIPEGKLATDDMLRGEIAQVFVKHCPFEK